MKNKDLQELIQKCPECFGKIELGIAINPNEEYGARYLIKPPLITYKTLELIPAYKCKKCGYSCDDTRDLIWRKEN